MGDASGVKAAQRDRGEARRSGLISSRLRRLTSAFAFLRENESHENVTGL